MDGSETTKTGSELLSSQPIVEPSERWIRVRFNGEITADSRRTLLLREAAGRLAYYFPEEDVVMKYLEPGQSGSDGRRYFDIRVGDRVSKNAAWIYNEPPSELDGLRGYFTFQWKKMDHWYEEDEEVFVHPRDPYHRVDMIGSSRHVRVELNGVILAESPRPTIVYETSLPPRYYLPMEDIRMELMKKTKAKTRCPYKGEASYWSINVSGESYRNFIWAYEDPIAEATKIRGLLCFFSEKIDLFVEGELQERHITPWS